MRVDLFGEGAYLHHVGDRDLVRREQRDPQRGCADACRRARQGHLHEHHHRACHGETVLFQKLDRDVSYFRHLYLQAMVRVDYADLSGGGTLNSEFPMMMRLSHAVGFAGVHHHQAGVGGQ